MSRQRSDRPTIECPVSDDRTITYTTGGAPEGSPVVFHHGTPGSRLIAELCSEQATAEGIRLLVPDRPGYGRSTSPPREWGWSEWRRDLNALLDFESIDQASFVGFSGGGPFALAAGSLERAKRVGLISSVIPPIEGGLSVLSAVPFAVRILFRLSKPLARVRGSEAVVGQYTDQSVPASVERIVTDDFHEALRHGANAVSRETRLFANESTASVHPGDVPIRAWHGTRDSNTPIAPVKSFVEEAGGTLVATDTDHLGTLLENQRAVFDWIS